MKPERPSKKLLVALAFTMVLAGAKLLGGLPGDSSGGSDEDFVPPDDLAAVEEPSDESIAPWKPPADPRDPFAAVDIWAPAADE